MSKSAFVVRLVLAAIGLLGCALAPAAGPPRQPVAIAAPVAIPHASDGIGDDDPLEKISGDYNLQMVFATQGSGEYLADIRVLIADVHGNTLLDAESSGPIFFVRLPAGSYRISADFHGTPLRKSVVVTDHRLQNLYFHWPRPAIEADTRRP